MINSLTYFAAACQTKGIPILPSWYKYLDSRQEGGRCTPIFAFPDDIPAILLALVEILLRIGVLVAVFYVIYGGFLYIYSQGEPDRAGAAKQTIMNAIIGFTVAVIATGVVSFIGGRLV